MKTEDKNFETIKSKILKLHALAERGEQGEAAIKKAKDCEYNNSKTEENE